jgi:lipoprotein signal peptidase
MKIKLRQSLIIAGGFLFALDRIFKIVAVSFWNEEKLLFLWLGWMPHYNPGIAFRIIIPKIIIIFASIIFFCVLAYLYFHAKNDWLKIGLILVALGALSNFFDRAIYGYTIDYFLATISMFNLADVLIVSGVGICLFSEFGKKKQL